MATFSEPSSVAPSRSGAFDFLNSRFEFKLRISKKNAGLPSDKIRGLNNLGFYNAGPPSENERASLVARTTSASGPEISSTLSFAARASCSCAMFGWSRRAAFFCRVSSRVERGAPACTAPLSETVSQRKPNGAADFGIVRRINAPASSRLWRKTWLE